MFYCWDIEPTERLTFANLLQHLDSLVTGHEGGLTGEIELHHLVLEDYDKLESRSYEMNKENINSTCSLRSEHLTQVRQTPLSISSPDDAPVPRLPSRSLGLSTPTSEHER